MAQLWAGIDAGKTHQHCVVIDTDGTRLYAQRVANDESALLNLIADVAGLTSSPGGGEVVWATDLNHGGAALLIALLAAHDQRLLYIPVARSITRPRRTAVNLGLWSPVPNRRPRTQVHPGSGAAHQTRAPDRLTRRHEQQEHRHK